MLSRRISDHQLKASSFEWAAGGTNYAPRFGRYYAYADNTNKHGGGFCPDPGAVEGSWYQVQLKIAIHTRLSATSKPET